MQAMNHHVVTLEVPNPAPTYPQSFCSLVTVILSTISMVIVEFIVETISFWLSDVVLLSFVVTIHDTFVCVYLFRITSWSVICYIVFIYLLPMTDIQIDLYMTFE